MFRVNRTNEEQDVKNHFASTEEIAEEVKSDLESNFGPMVIEPSEDTIYVWDPGDGVISIDDEIFYFSLKHITIACRSKHFDNFIDRIETKCPIKGNDVKYATIHGRHYCAAIGEDELNQLKEFICNNSEYVSSKDQAEKAKIDAAAVEKVIVAQKVEHIVGEAGAGLVKVTCTVMGNVIGVEIADEIFKKTDKKFISDLFVAALNDATKKVMEYMQDRHGIVYLQDPISQSEV